MKTILLISVVLAASVANAAPPPELVAKVTMIRTLVRETLDKIEAAAIADDAVIGQRIKDKLETEAEKAKGILHQARELWTEDTPTREQTGEMFKKFLSVLGDAKDAVKDDVKLLKEETQKTIVTTFKDSLAMAKQYAAQDTPAAAPVAQILPI